MEVNEQIALDHGLKKEEYKKICDLLKRTPNITELGVFSAMWNEHCSYKSSRLHLKKLPTKGKKVIQGPGENAGVIDIEDNDQIAVTYCDQKGNDNEANNPNGALKNIAGIFNKNKNILGMMPHPERMIDQYLSGEDGSLFFENLIGSL